MIHALATARRFAPSRGLPLLLAAVLTAACGGDSGTGTEQPPVKQPVATVAVVAPGGEMRVGAAAQLTATPRDAAGNALTGRSIVWESTADAVATVSGDGTVTARAPGAVTIRATSEGKTGEAALTITPRPVGTVTVAAPPSIEAGATLQLSAAVADTAGGPLTDREIAWSSSNAAVATVSATGVVAGVAAGGPVTITATTGGKSGTAQITVTPAPVATLAIEPGSATIQKGATVELRVIARDAAGNLLTGRAATLISSNAAVATIANTGVVTGVGEGSATITANVEGKSANATITVIPVPIATLAFVPDTASVEVGQTVQLRVVGRDAAGNELPGRTVTLVAVNPEVARIGADGVVTGVAAGTATIRASAEGRTATATVTVRPPSVATVFVTPNPVTVPAGETTQLTAILRSASGSQLTGRAVTWSSSDPAKASVSATGVVTGIAAGSVTITATSEGKTGNAQVTVPAGDQSAPRLTSFSFAPAALDITSKPDTMRVTLGISDPVAGVGRMFAFAHSPSGKGFGINSCARVSGTDTNGTWRCEIILPVGAEPGTYTFREVLVEDQLGNRRSYSDADLRAAGYATTFQVTGGAADTTAPTLTSFSFAPSTIDVTSAPDTLFVTMGIADAGTGVNRMFAFAYSPSGKGIGVNSCARVSGTDANGAWRCEIIFPRGSEGGTWTFREVLLDDNLGNRRSYAEADLRVSGYATTFQVTP
jgi:uncharacterized protein YjdB